MTVPSKLLDGLKFFGLYFDASVPLVRRDEEEVLERAGSWRLEFPTSEHKLDDKTILAFAATFVTESC